MNLKINRLEALADGIFSIVMTIMIISLIEMVTMATPGKEEDFYQLFLSLGNDFGVYVVSFLILGILWIEHHWQFHFVRQVTPTLIGLNIAWFIFLCLIPFTTMLLGNHSHFFSPLLAFEINILIVFLLLYSHWVYVVKREKAKEALPEQRQMERHKKIGFVIICSMFFIVVVSWLVFLFRHHSFLSTP